MKLKLNKFGGIAPLIAPKLLQDYFAQTAYNVELESGRLEPQGETAFEFTLPDATRKSIYKYARSGTALLCGTLGGTLAQWQAISNGAFKISIGGAVKSIIALDFRTCTDFHDCAAVIQDGIRAVTSGQESVIYDTPNNRMIIVTGDTAITVLSAGETSTTGYTNDDCMPTMSGASTPSGTASASTTYTTYSAWKAADDDTGTYWVANLNTLPSWWQYHFTRKYVISSFRFNHGTRASYSIRDFTLQGSNDGTTWTVIEAFQNTNTTNNAWLSFTVNTANRAAYSYYRINATSRNGTGNYYINLADIEFYHTPVDISEASFLNGRSGAVAFTDIGDTVTLNGHWFSDGDAVSFSTIMTTTGISTATTYYVVNASTNTFQLASSLGGSPLALTTNGTGVITDTGTVSTYSIDTWRSWVENDIDVARSPVNEDTYNRIYWTGEADGELTMAGTFTGDRHVKMSVPANPAIVATVANIIQGTGSPATMNLATASTVMTIGAAAQTAVACILKTFEKTSSGYHYVYTFPQTTYTGLSAAGAVSSSTTITFPSKTTYCPIGARTANDIGTKVAIKYPQTASNVHVADFEITSFVNVTPITEVHSGATPNIEYTVDEFDIDIIVNMNYNMITSTELSYLITYVNDLSMEGPPSAPTAIVHKDYDQAIELSSIANPQSAPLSDSTIEKIRIYRTAAGTDVDGDGWYYLTEIDHAVSAYTDTTKETDLSEKFSRRQNPATGMRGLIAMPNGFMVAFYNQSIYMSEINLPHSWPDRYNLTVDAEIVAIRPSGNDIIVMTKENPYIISGSSPATMSMARLMFNQSCVAKRGVAQVGSVVLYPSPDGLVQIYGGSAKLITDKIFSRDDWQALRPQDFIAECHDNQYHAFTTTLGLVIDFTDGAMVTTNDEYCAGIHSSLEDDRMYLIQGGEIVAWNEGATDKVFTWKSKEFQFPRPVCWNCAQVIADGYNSYSRFNLYAEGVLVSSLTPADFNSFRLPRLRAERVWSFEVVSQYPIDEVQLATSMPELQ